MRTDSTTGADLVVDVLESYGVSYVFGNPGTTELPVMNALSESDLEYVLCLHEDIAMGMAAGYASARRHHGNDVLPVGVANLHITPGVAHGLGNLYAAMHSGSPVVMTAGDYATDYQHAEAILGGDLVGMTQQFTKWSAEVSHVESLPTMLRRAFKTALTPPTGPVFLSLPLDVVLAGTDAEPERLGSIPEPGRGDEREIARAVRLLVEAEEPLLVAGDQLGRAGREATDAAVDFAEASGVRVHGEMMASEVNFPVDHDQWISPLSPQPSVAPRLLDTDTIVFAGCDSNMPLTRPDVPVVSPDTRCIFIGPDAEELGKNQPSDAAIVGDTGAVLSELAKALERDLPKDVLAERLERVAALKRTVAEKLNHPPDSTDPRASKREFVDRVQSAVPDAYVVDEAITTKQALMTRWPLQPEAYFGNKGGGLGYGLPAALGIALAERQRDDPRPTVAVVGDGSYLYYPHSLYTASRYDIDLTVVVPDNRNYRILKNNMADILGGTPEDYDFVGMDLDPHVDIPANAGSHGGTGYRVEDPAEIEPTIETAVAEDGPTVVDVLVHD